MQLSQNHCEINPLQILSRFCWLGTRSIGTQTIDEREQWLSKVDALQDEWIIERRIQLLIDEDKIQQAKDPDGNAVVKLSVDVAWF